MPHPWSFYQLTPANEDDTCTCPESDAGLFPFDTGVSAEEDVFCDCVEALRTALDTFIEAHDTLTWSDCIHAVLCLANGLQADYAAHEADA